jgi:hypothetical protein
MSPVERPVRRALADLDDLVGLEAPLVGVHLDEPLVTANEVARLLAVPRSSVYEYARRRDISVTRSAGLEGRDAQKSPAVRGFFLKRRTGLEPATLSVETMHGRYTHALRRSFEQVRGAVG